MVPVGSSVVVNDPVSNYVYEDHAVITQPESSEWLTPGSVMSARIRHRREVLYVGENFQPEELQTIIVLDDDTEEVLDLIFAVEAELFQTFNNLRLDVRVRVQCSPAELALIQGNTVRRYVRA